MQTCSGCGYLVPETWDECKKCGATLRARAARVPEPVAVPAPAVSVPPAAPFGGPVRGQGPGAEWSAAVRLQPAPPPAPDTPWGMPSPPASPHGPARAPNPATGPRISGSVIAALLAVLAVVGGVVFFVRGGIGGGARPAQLTFALPYVAPSGAFKAMLPCRPRTDQQVVPIGAGVSTTVSYAGCLGDDPVVMVGDAAVPAGTPGFDPNTALRGAADGATINGGGTIAEYTETLHDGLPAADVRISHDGATVRMRVVLGGTAFGGTRLVIAMVADDDGDPRGDFDGLIESLSVTP